MKYAIILVGFLMTQATWALDNVPSEFERKTWAEIEADNSLFVNWPMVMGVPINKVCLTKDKVKSLVPIRSCREWQISSASECKRKTDWCYTTNENLYDEGHPFIETYHKCMKVDINNKAQVSRLMTTTKCVETSARPLEETNYDFPSQQKCKKYKVEVYTFPQMHNVRITDYRRHNGDTLNWAYKDYAIPLCN